jgi:hypothetical protein
MMESLGVRWAHLLVAMCRLAQWRNIWANEPQTSAWYEKEQQWLLNPNEGFNSDVNCMFTISHVTHSNDKSMSCPRRMSR